MDAPLYIDLIEDHFLMLFRFVSIRYFCGWYWSVSYNSLESKSGKLYKIEMLGMGRITFVNYRVYFISNHNT